MSSPPQATPGVAEAGRRQLRPGSVMIAGLGSFIALASIGFLASRSGQPWILGSFGASCVLLLGLPQGPFSQPRNIIGGHVLASLIGLLFLDVLGPGWLPMAAAGGVAAIAMMLTRTVHPPAGSNPVIIFMAQPGWSFLGMPTAIGALTLVAIGWLYWNAQRRGSWPLAWWRGR